MVKKRFSQQAGVTLFEVLLVLVIGMTILYLSIQQYQSYRRDQYIRNIQYNVDTLFQALGKYYQANCSINPNVAPPDTPYLSQYYPNQSLAVDMGTLRAKGYLTEQLISSPLINSGMAGTSGGYVLQFNQYHLPNNQLPNRTIFLASSPTTPTIIGQIIAWQAQVSVSFNDATAAKSYAQFLGANCVSTLAGDFVAPCSAAAPGSFAVWQRQPSFPSPGSTSNYWSTMPVVKQFKQMYTDSPLSVIGGIPPQYFVCGS